MERSTVIEDGNGRALVILKAGRMSGKSRPNLVIFIGIVAATIHPAIGFASPLSGKAPPRDKVEVAAWLAVHMREYRQAYTLSCEIALIRMSLGLMGVQDVSEDDIL